MPFVRVTKKSATWARTSSRSKSMPASAYVASEASTAPMSDTGRPASSMAVMPMALRRSANGSDEPVGPWPTANRPQTVSSLSAMATTRPTSDAGGSSPEKRGR